MAPRAVETVTETRTVTERSDKPNYKHEIIWKNVVLLALYHLGAFYGLYLTLFHYKFKTFLWACVIGNVSGLGVTAGAHRLWSHRSYKAKLPLRILLVFMNTLAIETPIYDWARDHRVHHKFAETDADPHNVKRGFFFAHCGWLMLKKHPDVIAKGKTLDFSDLMADPVVRFQKRYYGPLALILFILPCFVPILWGHTFWDGVFVSGLLRYVISLHSIWSVNSVAHMYGYQPYDNAIHATQNTAVALIGLGEGWHNYHHVFPWDYATNELAWRLNVTTMFIDFMAKIGWAYDLKKATPEMVRRCKVKKAVNDRLAQEESLMSKVH